MVWLKRKIRKNDLNRFGDVILSNLRAYKLISSNHKSYFDEYSWIIRGAKLKVDKIVLVRLTLIDIHLI